MSSGEADRGSSGGRGRGGGAPSIWITRPAPANARTAGVVREAGYPVLAIPVLEVRILEDPDLPREFPPDWIVLVSANAADGLARGLERRGLGLGGDPRPRIAAVGERTRRRAEELGWTVTVVPGIESAEGLLQALGAQDLRGLRVWIPAGNRPGSARDVLPEALAGRGARPDVFEVYRTLTRSLTPDETRLLESAIPGAVVYHSPSAAEAVLGDAAPPAARCWRSALAVAVGAVTAGRARALGASPVVEAAGPSDRDILGALARVLPERTPS